MATAQDAGASGCHCRVRGVIAGLDPAIHLLHKKVLRSTMDPRVTVAGRSGSTRARTPANLPLQAEAYS
jgi:hypothetical protein